MLILLTLPTFFEEETELINQLFNAGLTILHVRKPHASQEQLVDFLQKIQPVYLKRIVIHSHYTLVNRYNLKGIHLTSRVWQALLEQHKLKAYIRPLQKRGLSVSASTHTLDEIKQLPTSLDYVFLSPFFDSISKANYVGNIDFEAVRHYLSVAPPKPALVALGGIQQDNLPQLHAIGMQHIALLGSIWQTPNPVASFQQWL